MFVVELSYVRALEEVDAQMEAHRAFLEEQYAAGVFLASGPKEPRTGGVILASAASRAELESIMARDPFTVHGVAACTITEFTVRTSAPGLEALVGA